MLGAFIVGLGLLILSPSTIEAAKCSVKNGDISARWQVADEELTIEVTTKNLGNNEWSAIGFGPDMSDLEVVIFQVVDNKPSLQTGATHGYGAPELDSSPNVALQSLNYNSNTLVARFSRPVGANGSRQNSLSSCSTWNFFSAQPLISSSISSFSSPTIQLNDVCPTECVQIFTERDVFTDPVPEAAVFNNRISNRFDLLSPSDPSRTKRHSGIRKY